MFLSHLKPGDRVAVVAPSGTVPDIETVLAQVRTFLARWQLEMVTYSDLIGTHPTLPAIAHTDAVRAQDFMRAVQDDTVQAIWPLRGGYGVLRLLPYLDQLPKPTKHKWVIGFSDISLLHAYVNAQWGWPSVHGPNLRGTATGHVAMEDVAALQRGLCEGQWGLPPDLRCVGIDGSALAQTTWVGGNLTVLSYVVGTPYAPVTHHRIVLLEDLAEPLRKLDGTLWHLYWGMQWEKYPPRAIVFGEFATVPEETPEAVACLLQEWEGRLQGLGIGCAYTSLIGHGERNYPVVLGWH